MLTDRQEANFWSYVNKTESCWLWTGTVKSTGYGIFRTRNCVLGEKQMPHRLMWVLKNGSIPDGLLVLHRCDVPLCCNPAHLFLGTHEDNMADMVSKGRSNGFDKRAGVHAQAIALAQTAQARGKRIAAFKAISHQQKELNSHYGTVWVMNPAEQTTMRIPATDAIPIGWVKGRRMTFLHIRRSKVAS